MPIGAWPLARREPEVDEVMDAMSDDGRSAAVLYGPAGVGKTRLADTCLALARNRGRRTAQVMASQAAAQMPLGALAPILPGGLPPDAPPAALFERARRELLALGDGDPIVLFVDDAHLLDTSSAVLLTLLLAAGAMFLVATIRDGEALPDAVAGWWRLGTTVRLDLEDLPIEGTGEVLTSALGGVVGAATTRRLHEASGGNPLLLRELVHQAIEDGHLSDASGTWRIAGALSPSRRLADVLAVRLAALSAPARRVVEQLAMCAPLGPAELTGEQDGGSITEGRPDDPGAEVPTDEIDALERSGLVRVVVDGHRHQLVLGHPLYGEVLRSDLGALHRRSILLAAAHRIEALGARRREDALRVATWRLDAGGTPDRELLLQAARFARYTHDFSQVERLAGVLWSEERTLEVAVLLGEAHYQLGHFADAETILSTAVPHLGNEHLLAQHAMLRSENLHTGLHDWKAGLVVVQEAQATIGPDHADDLVAQEGALWCSAALPRRALDAVAGSSPATARGRVLLAIVRAQALCRVGHTSEAISVAEEGFREHSTLLEPLAVASPGIHFVNQTFSLLEAGRYAEADELARLGYDGAVTQNLPFGQLYLAMALGRSCLQQGRIEDARRWFQEGASTASSNGFGAEERFHRCALAGAEAMLGNRERAATPIPADLPISEPLRFQGAIGLGWAAWAQGDPERARSILVSNAAEAAEAHNVGNASWLWHDAARLGARGLAPLLTDLVHRGDSPVVAARAAHVAALDADDAVALSAASASFEELGMVLVAAEACFSAAASYQRRGDQRTAAGCVTRGQAMRLRCQGADTPGLAVGRATSPLSSREREVATLAGTGLSSQEIADRLFISVRTVNNHLAHAYEKLGVTRRRQLAEALGG